jgi:hypothetical protein
MAGGRSHASRTSEFWSEQILPATWVWSTAAAGVLLLIGWASLTPFQLAPDVWDRFARMGLGRLAWPASDAWDLVTNFVAYVPLGILLGLHLGGNRSLAAALGGAVLCGALLSFSLESLQTLIVTRWPSWLDVATDAAGTATGALAWAVVRLTILRPPAVPVRARVTRRRSLSY